jgi:hypothetical protein
LWQRDGMRRVEKEKVEDDAADDVLAAASSSEAKLKPRLTMIEQQVRAPRLARCCAANGSRGRLRRVCSRCSRRRIRQ